MIEIGSAYRFTQEERKNLHQILKDYDEVEVQKFIECIEISLGIVLRIREYPVKNNADQVSKLYDMEKHFALVAEDLSEIESGPFPFRILPLRRWTFPDDLFGEDSHREEINRRAEHEAEVVLESIQKIRECLTLALQMEKRKKGDRCRADQLGIALQIAIWFDSLIGIPTRSKGPFPQIVIFCFKVLGIKGGDRRRAIDAALKKLALLTHSQ